MPVLVCAFLLACAPQDDASRWIADLASDDLERRDQAFGELVRRYPAWKDAVRAALASTQDPDVKERLRAVENEGERLLRKKRGREALPHRIRRDTPGFIDDLFSKDPATCARALQAAARTFTEGPADDPYRLLYLTPAEMRPLLPEISALIPDGPEGVPVRHAWVELLTGRPAVLEDAAGTEIARRLCRDEAPQVRSYAMDNLFAAFVTPPDIAERIARWGKLDRSERWHTIRHAARLDVAEARPVMIQCLDDPELAGAVREAVLSYRARGLMTEVLARLDMEPFCESPALIGRAGKPAIPILMKRLRRDRDDSYETLRALAALEAREAADEVAVLLAPGRENPGRHETIQCLAVIGGPAQAPAVAAAAAQCLNSSTPFPMAEAVQLLARWKAVDEIVGLLDLLPAMKYDALHLVTALEELRPAGASDKVARFLAHEDGCVRVAAVRLLAALGDSGTARARLDDIRAILRDERLEWNRGAAAEAAAKLGLRELNDFFVETILNPHVRSDSALRVLWTAQERVAALGAADPLRRIAALNTLLADDWEAAAPLLPRLAGDPDPRVRLTLAFVPQRFGRSLPVDVLKTLTADADPQVAEAAAARFIASLEQKDLVAWARHATATTRLAAFGCLHNATLASHPDLLAALESDPDDRVRDEVRQRRLTFVFDPRHRRELEEFLASENRSADLAACLRSLKNAALQPSDAAIVERFIKRMLESPRDAIRETVARGYMTSGTVEVSGVVVEACDLLIALDRARAEPILMRLLESDRPELQKPAAGALASLGCKKAVSRLRTLATTEIGDAVAVALGKLGDVPRDLLLDADPAFRHRGFIAAEHAADPAALDDLLRAYRTLKEGHKTIRGLAACVRPATAHRLMEALLTPHARARAEAITLLRLFPSVDCADAIAPFLDDNYMVSIAAAQYLLDRGDSRFLPKLLLRTKQHAQTTYAQVVARFGVRDEIAHLVRMVEEPEHAGWSYAYFDGLTALAHLRVREGFPAALKGARRTSGYSCDPYIRLLPALGDREAIPALLEFLRGKDVCAQLSAAAALSELGDRSAIPEIVTVLTRDWGSEGAVRTAVRLELRDLVASQVSKAERTGNGLERAIAAAARLDLPGAKQRAAELLDRSPETMLDALRLAWGERLELRRWISNAHLVTRTLRDAIRYLAWSVDRPGDPAPEIPATDLERPVPPGWTDDVWDRAPGAWSCFLDEQGRIVVDRQDRVVARWKSRLGRP